MFDLPYVIQCCLVKQIQEQYNPKLNERKNARGEEHEKLKNKDDKA